MPDRKKRYGVVAMLLAVLVCSAVTVMANNLQELDFGVVSVGRLTFSFRYISLILLSGIFGEVPGMLCVLIVFLHELVLNRSVAFLNFIFLVIVIVSYQMSRRRHYLRLWKSVCAGIAMTVLLGNVWGILSDVLQEHSLLEYSAETFLPDFLVEVPECLFSALVLYLFFRFVPDRIKAYTPLGQGYTKESLAQSLKRIKGGSQISVKITTIIVGEAVVLSVFAAVFANLLLPSVMRARAPGDEVTVSDASRMLTEELSLPPGVEAFGERMQERIDQGLAGEMGMDTADFFVFSRSRVAFDLKLIMMIMTLAVPIAVLTNFVAQRTIAQPISRMSQYLKHFAQYQRDEASLRASADSIRALDIRSRDEIGELYQSIDVTVHQIVDNLDRMKKETELENDLRVAQAASEAKSSFLSNMSHEIRTPINAVLGMDEMILRESGEENTLEYAANIQNAGRSLLSLVNDILDFSKIEAGKMEILPVQYELSSTINDLINMIAARAQEKHLLLEIHVDEAMPHLLYGDEVRLKQVVTNILTNAVKYTERGSVTMDIGYAEVLPEDGEPGVRAESGEARESGSAENKIWLTVRVADTGIGMKEEDLGKLFSPFERIEEIRNRTIEGTGLGMSIVKKLLAMMDTKLTVKSVYGEGSEFSFRVLQGVVDPEPIGDFAATYKKSVEGRKRYQESFHAPSARILVTDDTPMNLTVIRALLKATGLQVDTAESGAQTLEKVRTSRYDVLFIDHMMPEMDGLQTLAALRAMPVEENLSAGAPVVALTANAVAGARETYLSAGFTDYLSKPIDAAKLEKLLLALLPADKVIRAGEPGFADAPAVGTATNKISDDIETGRENTAEMRLLRGIPGIDLDAALAATGSAEVLMEVMREFRLAIPDKRTLIGRLAQEENWREYTVQVHALKSSARLIGASALSAEAARLEACGNAEDKAEILRATPALLEAYGRYEDALAPLAEETDDEGKEPIDPAALSEARESLREAVTAQDFDTADELLHMLRDYRLPDGERQFWDEIRRRVMAVDRDGLLEIL